MLTVADHPERSSKNGWPRALRARKFRELVPSPGQTPHVAVKLAETDEERTAAFRLLHDEYVRAGLAVPNESGMRITRYHKLPTTRVVIAVREGTVVGTLSVIQRTSAGVPAESLFDLSPLCANGARVEEVSSLTVEKSLRASGTHGAVMFRIFRFALHDSVDRGVDHWVATFHPRHRYLYEELLGFTPLAEREIKSYEFVNGAPAMGGSVAIQGFQRLLAGLYGEQTPHTAYTFLSEREPHENTRPRPALVVA